MIRATPSRQVAFVPRVMSLEFLCVLIALRASGFNSLCTGADGNGHVFMYVVLSMDGRLGARRLRLLADGAGWRIFSVFGVSDGLASDLSDAAGWRAGRRARRQLGVGSGSGGARVRSAFRTSAGAALPAQLGSTALAGTRSCPARSAPSYTVCPLDIDGCHAFR